MIDRRNFLAGSGAALFTLNAGRLNTGHLAPWQHPTTVTGQFEAQDWATGNIMWDGGFSDMPYLVAMPDGTLLSTLTVSDTVETGVTQHVIILRSTDNGETWTEIAEMEPAAGPESSWGMPWLHNGRLYVLYTYNVNDVRISPFEDVIGVISYRSSTDGGQTWSTRRDLIYPATAIDQRNPWTGAHRLLWTCGHVVDHDGGGLLGMTKIGANFNDTEAFTVKVVETVPGELTCQCSPAIATPPNAEEPSPLVFDDGVINVAFRTTSGRQGEAWSADNGTTWQVGWAEAQTGGIVPQPRAKAAQFLLPDGRVFLWGHNTAGDPATWGPRNPVTYRLGVRHGPRLLWGPPRLLLWDQAMATTMSYPSVIVVGDELLVAATDKKTAKVFRFPLP